MLGPDAIGLVQAAGLRDLRRVRRRGGVVAVAIVRHGQREPLLPAEPALPEPPPLELDPAEPAPVSVLMDPVAVPLVELGIEAVVEVVSVVEGVAAVVEVVSVVGGVVPVVTAEPGVALAPELLLAVFAPFLQPAMPAAANAATAM